MPLLNLVFVVGLLVILPKIGQGLPEIPLRIVLILPLLGAVLTLVLLGATVSAWIQGRGTLFARAHSSALAAAGTAFVFVLHIWKLLGWRL